MSGKVTLAQTDPNGDDPFFDRVVVVWSKSYFDLLFHYFVAAMPG